MIPGESFSEAYVRVRSAAKRARLLLAEAQVANEHLGDRQGYQDATELGTKLLSDLKALQDWIATVEAALETIDQRGINTAGLDTLREKRAKLDEWIAAKEAKLELKK